MITLAMLDSCDEQALKRVFTWQTKSGLAPSFGSRPIAWYQMHQCEVSRILRAKAAVLGVLQEHYAVSVQTTAFDNKAVVVIPCNTNGRTNGLAPVHLGFVDEVYSQADDECRR